MKSHSFLIFFFTFLLFDLQLISAEGFANPSSDEVQRQNSDTTGSEATWLIIKVNPYQYILSEIPVSVEFFTSERIGIQIQVGYIFPKREDYFAESLFEMNGPNATASTNGILSYRNTPFLNEGFSVKVEFRNYRNSIYFAPQVMVKHYSYSNMKFPVFTGNVTMDYLESRTANVAGFGCMVGQQRNDRIFSFEWYAGGGLRFKGMSTDIHGVYNPTGYKTLNRNESKASVYPFINLGVRIGFRFRV